MALLLTVNHSTQFCCWRKLNSFLTLSVSNCSKSRTWIQFQDLIALSLSDFVFQDCLRGHAMLFQQLHSRIWNSYENLIFIHFRLKLANLPYTLLMWFFSVAIDVSTGFLSSCFQSSPFFCLQLEISFSCQVSSKLSKVFKGITWSWCIAWILQTRHRCWS